MNPRHYPEPGYLAYGSFDGHFPHPSVINFREFHPFRPISAGLPTTPPHAQHGIANDFDLLPFRTVRDPTHQNGFSPVPSITTSVSPTLLLSNPSAPISGETLGTYPARLHPAHLSYADKAIQTVDPNTSGGCQAGQEELQTLQPRKLVPQESYRAPGQPRNFGNTNPIEFIVNGEEGIRLSDVSEDKWVGFEGGDDRSLFEGERLQIMIRLHFVGCSPWHSKIPTTDFTAKRRPITRKKLAAEVAKSMKKYIAREKLNGHDDTHPRCNWGDASLENVLLTRMIRVSAASWQPEFFVERSSALQTSSPSPNPFS